VKHTKMFNEIDFSYTGHESFPLRISWLPKAVAALEAGIDPFSDPREGMTRLGLGKNMIQSLAYWVVVTNLAEKTTDGLKLTGFAEMTLSRKTGFDPFLENTQTLWLLHWNLCQGWQEADRLRRPYAWHYYANLLADDELAPSETIERFTAGPLSRSTGKELSFSTLRQHFEIFVKTYVAATAKGARSTPEDALDSPLTTLGLIKEGGDRKMLNGRRETVYRVNNAAKPTISKETFRHCLHEWWTAKYPGEETLTVRQITTGEDSPGRCFRLPEAAVHQMLTTLSNSFPKEFVSSETRQQRTVSRGSKPRQTTTLKAIFHP
jgi:hypothetical protein